MNNAKVIKTIEVGICPHCSKEIIISSKMSTPIVDWVLRKEDVDKAKQTVREEINKINPTDKKDILAWLDNEETIIGPSDVNVIINQLTEREPKVEEKVEEKKADK